MIMMMMMMMMMMAAKATPQLASINIGSEYLVMLGFLSDRHCISFQFSAIM